MHKLHNQPKSLLCESIGFCHDFKVQVDLLLFSLIYSSMNFFTKQDLGLFDVMDDGIHTLNDKLKFIKYQWNGSRIEINSQTSSIYSIRNIDNGQLEASKENKHLEAILTINVESSLSYLKKRSIGQRIAKWISTKYQKQQKFHTKSKKITNSCYWWLFL